MATELQVEIISIILVFFFFYVGYLIFFRIKKKQVEKKVASIELCPKCRSWNRNTVNPWTIGFLPEKYACQDCDYQGNFVLVDHDRVRDFRNKLKKRKTKRVSTKK